ncbi:phage major capsid protein [Nesterenkonia sp. HG001]|uniref:phage major capsid protein n=1 Tax=Nesterenkonia sp. HG001 TaxID=2983207 RepID=UPI002AC3E6C7|nr:phage major capsid protein [Nesterenkonia sp. HG001]MDZ5077874.1 phage major capsid protein [Nesterenkonia sp. HG001]
MPSSIELRQQRASVVEQTRELVTRSENENRDLSAEERQSYERMNNEFRSLTDRIERVEEQEARDLEMARSIPNPENPEAGSRESGAKGYRTSNLPGDAEARDARMAFLDLIRHGRGGLSPEARALVQDEAGEILVPEALETELRRDIPALTVVRNIAGQRTIGTNRVRRRSLDEVSVGWGKLETGDQSLSDSMPSTPQEEYTYIQDLYGLAKIGEDELMDSDVDLEAFVRDSFARAIAEAEDTAFTIGGGNSSHQPTGFMTSGGGVSSVDAGQADGVTVDDFKKLIYAVPSQARRNGRFILASTTELLLSTLKDDNGQYLWQPSVQAGRPNTFLGYALENQEDIAEVPGDGSEQHVAAFGDFNAGYRVYDRMGVTLKRLEELYAEEGMVGFKVHFRVGGDVTNPAYLRRLRVPATG